MTIIRVILRFLMAASCSILIGAVFTLYVTGFISPAMAALEEAGSTIVSDFQQRLPEALEDSGNLFIMKRWWSYAAGAGAGSATLRSLVAFIGVMILIIGARWAGECTDGHAISGTLRMTVGGRIAIVGFFLNGILAAFIIYGLS